MTHTLHHNGRGVNFLITRHTCWAITAVLHNPVWFLPPATMNPSNYGSVQKIKSCSLNPGILQTARWFNSIAKYQIQADAGHKHGSPWHAAKANH